MKQAAALQHRLVVVGHQLIPILLVHRKWRTPLVGRPTNSAAMSLVGHQDMLAHGNRRPAASRGIERCRHEAGVTAGRLGISPANASAVKAALNYKT